MTDISNFAKYEVTGAGAGAFLSDLLTNAMPKPGRMVLAPMLNERGRIIGDFTVANAGPDLEGHDVFRIWGSSQAQIHHMRWFEAHRPKPNGEDTRVHIRNVDLGLNGISIAGPKANEVLAALTDEDVSLDGFRFMDHREMTVAQVPAQLNRISFTGDLGYEIWVRPEYLRRLWFAIAQAGAAHGIRPFGMRAMSSMRLEKHFGAWATEFRPIYTPFEAGLDRFVSSAKNRFVGRDAAMAERDAPRLTRVCLEVDAGDADCIGDEPIWLGDEVIGWITSGGYGHHVEQSLAQGYIPREHLDAAREKGLQVEVIGEMRPARVQDEPPFDPKGERMRRAV